jgi:K+-sensing histidine kinase KdpD
MRPVEALSADEGQDPTPSTSPARDLRLLSSVCHDMKAPLASIVVGAGFLRKVLPKDNLAALRVVDAMHRAASRMDQLIVNFGDLGKLETRELSLDIRSYPVRETVQTAFEQLRADATGDGITVALAMSAEAASTSIRCDRNRLLQILAQLSACTLRVAPDGSAVTMHVSTSGSNIRFEMTTQTADGSSRRIGSDLPRPQLAIAQGLIELHGAALDIDGDAHTLTLGFALAVAAG